MIPPRGILRPAFVGGVTPYDLEETRCLRHNKLDPMSDAHLGCADCTRLVQQAYRAHAEKQREQYEASLREVARRSYQQDVSNVATQLFSSILLQELPRLMRASEFDKAQVDLQGHLDTCVIVAKTFVDTVNKIEPPKSTLDAIMARNRGGMP